jgi:hypothetical protein
MFNSQDKHAWLASSHFAFSTYVVAFAAALASSAIASRTGANTTQKSFRSVSHMRVLICQRLKHAPLNTSGLMTSELEAIVQIDFLECCNFREISDMLLPSL